MNAHPSCSDAAGSRAVLEIEELLNDDQRRTVVTVEEHLNFQRSLSPPCRDRAEIDRAEPNREELEK